MGVAGSVAEASAATDGPPSAAAGRKTQCPACRTYASSADARRRCRSTRVGPSSPANPCRTTMLRSGHLPRSEDSLPRASFQAARAPLEAASQQGWSRSTSSRAQGDGCLSRSDSSPPSTWVGVSSSFAGAERPPRTSHHQSPARLQDQALGHSSPRHVCEPLLPTKPETKRPSPVVEATPELPPGVGKEAPACRSQDHLVQRGQAAPRSHLGPPLQPPPWTRRQLGSKTTQ
mmetsp:Transcript_44202/g.82684  ORF Transcript_44202/g.82684 Transcript_44202/m.82684 type:complete len:232 (+) Transcript_44202:431-1126(+)